MTAFLRRTGILACLDEREDGHSCLSLPHFATLGFHVAERSRLTATKEKKPPASGGFSWREGGKLGAGDAGHSSEYTRVLSSLVTGMRISSVSS